MSTNVFKNTHITKRQLYCAAYDGLYVLCLYDMKIAMRVFQTLVARTPYLMYDVYTNDSLHGVCFPTVVLVNRFGSSFAKGDHSPI